MSETMKPAKATKAAPSSEWAIKKKIRLPRKGANEENFEFVGINGKGFQVPCGKEIEVPLPVYEVLIRQQQYRDALIDVQESIPNEG